MIVTLWEEKAAQFQEGLAGTEGSAAFVVITGILAKQYSGEALITFILPEVNLRELQNIIEFHFMIF